MARIIFFALPAHAHSHQTLALTKELVDRGEDVTYYTSAAFESTVRRTGARFRRYRSKLLERASPAAGGIFRRVEAARDVLREELTTVRNDRPECIIRDAIALWGVYFSRLLDIPAVASISTVGINSEVMHYAQDSSVGPKSVLDLLMRAEWLSKAAESAREIVDHYGIDNLPPLHPIGVREKLNIVYTSRLFQPLVESFDDSYRFVGPVVPGIRPESDFPWDWITSRTLVYVSQGTVFNQDRKLFRDCIEVLRAVDCQVVISTGTGLPADTFGDLPANVLVRPFVPQAELIGRSAACITNGGLHTISDCLYHGVPVVAIPFTEEHAIQSRRVEELGAGIRLSRPEATGETLRDALYQILTDPRYRRSCQRIGDSFRQCGGVKQAAAEIQQFIRTQSSRTANVANTSH